MYGQSVYNLFHLEFYNFFVDGFNILLMLMVDIYELWTHSYNAYTWT